MEEEKVNVVNLTVQVLGDLLKLVAQYGFFSVLIVGFIILVIWQWKSLSSWIISVFGGSVKALIYEERIKNLEIEQMKERVECQKQIAEMRSDYENKLRVMEEKIDALIATQLLLSVKLGVLDEKLKAAQLVAEKNFGISVRKRN